MFAARRWRASSASRNVTAARAIASPTASRACADIDTGTTVATVAAAAPCRSDRRVRPDGECTRGHRSMPIMERRRLGRTDIDASVLGFGGSEIGYENATPRVVERLLRGAIDAGLNVIDTDSETLIGDALGDRRRDVFVFTKCGHERGWGSANWKMPSILRSIERSLMRLRTDHVDLVQLHSCLLAVLKRGDCIEALERARERGLTRYIGYSGDADAARYAVECGRFDTLQTSVSVADQQAITLTLPLASERGMGVIAKRPIANVAWRYAEKPDESYHQT